MDWFVPFTSIRQALPVKPESPSATEMLIVKLLEFVLAVALVYNERLIVGPEEST